MELFNKARGITNNNNKKPQPKEKTKESSNGQIIEPDHLQELKSKGSSILVDFEPDYIDLRMDTDENFTRTGRLAYINPKDVPVGVFEPHTVLPDAAIACFGRRRSGKSYFVRDLLYCFKDYFDRGFVYTGTKANYFFQRVPDECLPEDVANDLKEGKAKRGFIPEQAVIDGYKPHQLGAFLDLQMDIRENAAKWRKTHNYELPAFVLLDDVVDDVQIQRDGQTGHLMSLYSKGRHYKLMCIINTQYPRAIPARMRDNLDYAVIFRLDSALEKDAMLSHFMGELPPRTAEEMLRMYTHSEPHGPTQVLIVDMRASTPFDEKFKTYVANPDLPEFMMGSETYQKEMAYRPKETGELII